MGEKYVVVRTNSGTWHRDTCLWVHIGGVTRRRERTVSDADVPELGTTCDHCLGE
jgi:hypothetical protein